MVISTKIYEVNSFKQLIELNDNKTNFDLSFEVKSENSEPFKALVISETDLNSGNEINYQNVLNGYISGNITNDKGVFQTYFLLLKTDIEKTIKCTVTLDLKDIPLNAELQKFNNEEQIRQMEFQRQREFQNQERLMKTRQEHIMNQRKNVQENYDEKYKTIRSKAEPNKDNNNKTWIYIGIAVLVGLGIWYYLTSKKPSKPQLKNSSVDVPKLELISDKVDGITSHSNLILETPSIEIPSAKLEIPTPSIEIPSVASNSILESKDFGLNSTSGINTSLEIPQINLAKNDSLMRKLNNFFDSEI